MTFQIKPRKIKITKKRMKKFLPSALGILGFIFLVLLIIILNTKIISFVFTMMLIILGCLSSQFRKLTGDMSLGIEFIIFSTIMFYYSNSIMFAVLASFFMMAVSSILSGRVGYDILINTALFTALGFISMFLNFGIAMNGIILSVLYNIISFAILTFLGFDFVKNITFFLGSVIFNIILFKYFSPVLFSLL